MALKKNLTQNEKDKFVELGTDTAVRTSIVGSDGNPVSVQYPLSVDGDSVYAKDIDIALVVKEKININEVKKKIKDILKKEADIQTVDINSLLFHP